MGTLEGTVPCGSGTMIEMDADGKVVTVSEDIVGIPD